MKDKDLVQDIQRMKNLMIDFSCWGNYNHYRSWGEKENLWIEYKTLRVKLNSELELRWYNINNEFYLIEDFYYYYKDEETLWSYASRKSYINWLYKNILEDIETKIILNKGKIDETVNQMIIQNTELEEINSITEKIQHAKSIYFQENATQEEKRAWIKALADCFELHKQSIKEEYFSWRDESDFFNIANNYAIRHFNKSRKEDYDIAIFGDWMFLTYYNALKLIFKLKKRYEENKWLQF